MHDPFNNSVIAAIDGDSKTVKTGYGYSPFGDKIVANSSNSSSNNLRYAGREQDSNSWYYYMRGRYYIPGHHRYTMEDPLGFAGGDTNLYRYVGNNPHTDSDPSGLEGDDRGDGSGGTPYDLAPVIVIGPRSILDPNAPVSFLVGTGVTIGAPGIGGGGGGNGSGSGRPFPPTSPPDMTPKQPNPSDPNGPMMPTRGVPLLLAQFSRQRSYGPDVYLSTNEPLKPGDRFNQTFPTQGDSVTIRGVVSGQSSDTTLVPWVTS
ncbi:RHS repeat-associated core domain-containing protein [Gloeobacter kilaueensis]|uniref:RHS repeat-associated core domain-containing protein n=1 Tax=Gloeobacter kilaueensis TaxID=1416614 RepID=UPI0008FFAFDA|nr:RHS repeat-associated core domain-containing protein [Gloeobacter kilaueensis]